MQAVAPAAALKKPTEHTAHASAPGCDDAVPAGHSAQPLAAEVGGADGLESPKVPAGQGCVQLAWPATPEK